MKKGEKENREMELFGIINPLDWDKDDNIVSIEISTDEDDYIVELDEIGKDLFECVGEEVALVGVITKSKTGSDRIRVLSYEILEYDEDDDDDDEYYEEDFDDEDEYYDDDDDDEYYDDDDDDAYYDDDDDMFDDDNDEYRDDKR